MSNDRTIRRLTALEQSASTARVLNLVSAHRRNDDDPDFVAAPMFEHRLLDRSIILKHRLRPHEYAFFDQTRGNVTKLLIPIDPTDLKLGARYVFVGQRDFETLMESVFGDDLRPGSRDRRVLEMIDSLPSLDPFLLREQLRRNDIEPARAYFGISDADVQRMYDFVRQEVMALASLSASGESAHISASKLVEKLLSTTPDTGLGPLKDVLKLDDKEYQDGIFCWRGFLYYKWVLGDLIQPMHKVMNDLGKVYPRGPRDPEASQYIPVAKQRIGAAIAETVASVQRMLSTYDTAYASLTQNSKPMAFREFLLSAPEMFMNLGEQLGAVQHIVSFWRYRFPGGKPPPVSAAELMEILLDFEDGLSFATAETQHVNVA